MKSFYDAIKNIYVETLYVNKQRACGKVRKTVSDREIDQTGLTIEKTAVYIENSAIF